MRMNRCQPAFKKVAAERPALARGAKSTNRHGGAWPCERREGERIEMSVDNTKEANVDDDDDIGESLETDADSAIGFPEQRAELRRALRALWRGSPELKQKGAALSPDTKTATREVAAR